MKKVTDDLLALLIDTRANAYAPYSGFSVAAVIECPDGARFAGCNVETAHYKSICAEASAISAMVAAGRHRVRKVWILGGDEAPCPPCGDCRQRLFEFSDEHTRVLLIDPQGQVCGAHTIGELLPGGFTLNPGTAS